MGVGPMRYCENGTCTEAATWRRQLDHEHPHRSTEAYCDKHKAQKEENSRNWVQIRPDGGDKP